MTLAFFSCGTWMALPQKAADEYETVVYRIEDVDHETPWQNISNLALDHGFELELAYLSATHGKWRAAPAIKRMERLRRGSQ